MKDETKQVLAMLDDLFSDHRKERIEVAREVWDLYALAWRLSGGRSTLLEWDANLPDFATVHGEARKSLRHRSRSFAGAS